MTWIIPNRLTVTAIPVAYKFGRNLSINRCLLPFLLIVHRICKAELVLRHYYIFIIFIMYREQRGDSELSQPQANVFSIRLLLDRCDHLLFISLSLSLSLSQLIDTRSIALLSIGIHKSIEGEMNKKNCVCVEV
jgi:hypothetical protein